MKMIARSDSPLKKIALAGLLVLSCVALAQEDESKEIRAREAFERQLDRGSAIAPAQGRLTAFFEVKNLPQWTDRNGFAPKWEEIGPKVIMHSWGDMENAGRMCAIVVNPENSRQLYAGAASGGIWRSDDEGGSWKPVGDQAASLSIGALAIDPFDTKTIYAGTGEPHYSLDSFHGAGFLRSKDSGKTWQLLGADVFIGYRFCRIVPDPKRPGIIYAATTRGVYRSSDGGGSWVELLSGPASDLLIHPSSPNTLIAAIGNAWGSKANGLYKTTDAGATWHRIDREMGHNPMELGRIQMSACQAYPNVVYASMYGNSKGLRGFYKSTDYGDHWVRLPNTPNYAGDTAWYYNCVTVSPTNPNVVFVCGFSTFRTLDGGETWLDNTRSYDGGPVHPDHHYLTFSPTDSKTVYLCADGGAFRSRNLGESWESVSHGLATVQFQSVDVHPWDPNIAYGGTQDNGTNKFTGDKAWTNIFLGDGGVTRVNPKNPDVVYTEYTNLAILKSTNGGKDWAWDVTNGISRSEGKLFYAPYNFDPSNPDILVAGAERVYRTTDATDNWSAISPKLGSRVSAVTVAPNNSKVIYAGTSDGRVWVTPNTGEQWYEITKGLPSGYINDICIDPDDARTVYVAQGGWNSKRLWKSTDAGGSWRCLSDDLPPLPIQALVLHPVRSKTLYAATAIGVFVTDGDGRWKRFGQGLPNVQVFSIVANQKTGYITIGTHGRGAWRIALPD